MIKLAEIFQDRVILQRQKEVSIWGNTDCAQLLEVYFAIQLREKLNVPVGIVGCSWGRTSASAWIDDRILRENDKLKVYTDEYDRAVENLDIYKYEKKDYKMRCMLEGAQAAAATAKKLKEENTSAAA